MTELPDIVGLSLVSGQSRLRENGLIVGNIYITQAPGAHPTSNLRIVKQQLAIDGRIDLVAVYDLSSVSRKEV